MVAANKASSYAAVQKQRSMSPHEVTFPTKQYDKQKSHGTADDGMRELQLLA